MAPRRLMYLHPPPQKKRKEKKKKKPRTYTGCRIDNTARVSVFVKYHLQGDLFRKRGYQVGKQKSRSLYLK
jgi:hypothetical protein